MLKQVDLYEHNIPIFESFKKMIEEHNLCMLDSCPGSGKSYILLKYLEKYNGKTLIISPKNVISDEWVILANKYDIDLNPLSYQKFAKLDTNYIDTLTKQYDCFVFDECHHMGAPVWQINIDYLRKNYPDKTFIGLTATPIRYHDKQRDVGKDFFNGYVVKGLSQIDAVEQGILPGYKYIAGLFQYSDRLAKLKKVADVSRYNKDVIYEKIKRLEECPENELGVYEAFDRYLPDKNRKGIVFVSRIAGVKYAEKIMCGYFGENENYFIIHSGLNVEKNKISVESFKQVDHGWLFVVDMLNEGLHIPEVNTIVMLRNTVSPNLYIQQLGRSQSVGGKGAIIFDFMGNRKSLKIPGFKTFISGDKSYAEYKADPRIIVNYYETDALHLLKEIEWNLRKCKPWTKEEDNIIKKYYLIDKEKCLELLSDRTECACSCRAQHLGLVKANLWTREEDEILKNFYSTLSWKLLLKKLPNRTRYACAARACKLGLKREVNKKWTKEEDNILIKNYQKLGAYECSLLLPNRTKCACNARAGFLGLTKIKTQNWSEEDIQILKDYYPIFGRKYCSEKLKKYTPAQCMQKATRLGIKCEYKHKSWTPEEEKILKKFYPKYGAEKCVEYLPNRTIHSCKQHALRLKLFRESFVPDWTVDENEILIKNYQKLGAYECSLLLPNRTECACRAQARKLGIYSNFYWTKEEDDFLIKNYRDNGAKYCVDNLENRTYNSVRYRAITLGLTGQNKFQIPKEIDGYVYESIVQQYLMEHDFRHIMLTNKSGDYGVDIVVEKDGIKYAVQCKYWSKPVGIDAVRQVVTGKDIYGCDKCIVVTNNTFTKPAENLAVMHDVILMEHIDETNLKQPA